MAGIATVVLITTINLRMAESVSEAGGLVSLFVTAGLLHPSLPSRSGFATKMSLSDFSISLPLTPLDSTTLLKIGRGGAESIAI